MPQIEHHSLQTFNDQNFTQEVEESKNKITVVDFWAPWCGPCLIMSPILEETADLYKDNNQIKIGKLNIDDNQQTSGKYDIMSIPTIKIFANGEIIDEVIGAVPKEVLTNKINQALTNLKA